MNCQVQDTLGNDGRKKGVNEITGQDPGKPAPIVEVREQSPFELDQVTEESQVKPWIDAARRCKEAIVLAP
jgi:hypothetical protein